MFYLRVTASKVLMLARWPFAFIPHSSFGALCGELLMVRPGSPFVSYARFALTSFAAVVCGCTSSNDLVGVSGKVTFKSGKAVNRGSIEFASEANGMRAGARIADGLYSIPRDKGLKPGKYLVRIYAPSSLLSGNGGPGGAGKLPEETVSAKYNVKSQLTIEVGPAGKQEFDFQVEKAGP